MGSKQVVKEICPEKNFGLSNVRKKIFEPFFLNVRKKCFNPFNGTLTHPRAGEVAQNIFLLGVIEFRRAN
jgi:hypothetical protein